MNKLDRQFINWIFESAAVIVAFTLLGSMLDKKFATGANILSMLLLLGFVWEGWQLYKIVKRAEKK